MKTKHLLLWIFLFGYLAPAIAQEEEKESAFQINTDIFSRYVWRGTDFGASPSIQPCISYTKGGLEAGVWAAYTTNRFQTQEFDLYITYTFLKEMISLTLTDYFFPNEQKKGNRYFEYDKDNTGHIFEFSASFNGTEKLPLEFLVATNIYGDDAKKKNGDIFYSTYLEAAYAFKNLKLFAGFNFTESGFYANNIGFCNIGATFEKELKITELFSLPVSASVITNPQTENVFLVVGISF